MQCNQFSKPDSIPCLPIMLEELTKWPWVDYGSPVEYNPTGRANPNIKTGMELRKLFGVTFHILTTAPAAELMPNVLLAFLWISLVKPRGGF